MALATDERINITNDQDKIRYFSSAANALLQAPGFVGQLYVCQDGNVYIANGLTAGNLTPIGSSNFVGSSATTFTALANGGQGTAPNITTRFTLVTTVATGADSCTLPNATGSLTEYLIANAAASNSTTIYGFTGDKINGGSANAGVTCAAGKARRFVDVAANNWQSWLSA